MRDIQKVIPGELLTKQAIRKNILLYIKNTYMLQLHLKVVTAGIVTLVI
jgi:hypothetical protein